MSLETNNIIFKIKLIYLISKYFNTSKTTPFKQNIKSIYGFKDRIIGMVFKIKTKYYDTVWLSYYHNINLLLLF